MRRSRKKKDYWRQHYLSYQQSGLSQREYCSQHELGYWSFNQWKRTFEKAESNTEFQEIPLKVASASISENQITIEYQGIKITVPSTVSTVTLNSLFSVLLALL